MQQPHKSQTGLIIGVGVIALCLVAILVIASLALFNRVQDQIGVAQQASAEAATGAAESGQTAAAEDRATSTAQSARTATAQAGGTATARAHATGTAVAEAQATAAALVNQTATAQAAATQIADAQDGRRLAGPLTGQLTHDADEFLEVRCAGLWVADFAAQVTFTVPYSAPAGTWSAGFLLRAQEGDNAEIRLAIQAGAPGNGWYLIDSQSNVNAFFGGVEIHTDEGEQNTLLVIAEGSSGAFFLNGEFASDLDLSAWTEMGDVCVAIEFFDDDSTDVAQGKVTGYSDFTVWQYP